MPVKVQDTVAKLLARVVVPAEQDAVVRVCVCVMCVCDVWLCAMHMHIHYPPTITMPYPSPHTLVFPHPLRRTPPCLPPNPPTHTPLGPFPPPLPPPPPSGGVWSPGRSMG